MIRRAWNRTIAVATALLIAALVLLAALAMGSALDDSANAVDHGSVRLTGDDNGDGQIDEDESGWDCRTMGNHVCGPVPAECREAGDELKTCVAVASRPAFGWTTADGDPIDMPDGHTVLRTLGQNQVPGSPRWASLLRNVDAQWRAHH
ncbi:hypothetical protein ACFYZ9_33685 [Streptomyces sp. NPDC001691]|uniref:hypothetical protein n=1 Tax=Streptomyces sp. NPDC001691 TaxID=3364600 RepID=UPI003688AA2A